MLYPGVLLYFTPISPLFHPYFTYFTPIPGVLLGGSLSHLPLLPPCVGEELNASRGGDAPGMNAIWPSVTHYITLYKHL